MQLIKATPTGESCFNIFLDSENNELWEEISEFEYNQLATTPAPLKAQHTWKSSSRCTVYNTPSKRLEDGYYIDNTEVFSIVKLEGCRPSLVNSSCIQNDFLDTTITNEIINDRGDIAKIYGNSL